MWRCAICDREFEAIPEDAVLISRHTRSRTYVYKFGGDIHALRKIRIPKSESVPPPLEPPKEDTELLNAVVEVLAELPKPQPEIKSEPEIEIEDSSMTSMELAFRRQRNN
jgi:hypothetical protein